MGRKTVSNEREYTRVWIYVPTKLSQDSNFRFHVGDPCEIEMDTKTGELVVKPISREDARKLGWSRRVRAPKK